MHAQDLIPQELVAPAIVARENAQHYNGFKVGCVGYYHVGGGNLALFVGANTKRTPTEKKHCAEMQVMRDAAEAGIVLALLIVVGQPRAEDVRPTLHPCEACRTLMRGYMKEGKVVNRATRIICINALTGCGEEFTVVDLYTAHGESPDEY